MKTTIRRLANHSMDPIDLRILMSRLRTTADDDSPVCLTYILDLLGLNSCLWATRTLPEYSRVWRTYAVDCCEHMLPTFSLVYPDIKVSDDVLSVVRLHAAGGTTVENNLMNARLRAKTILDYCRRQTKLASTLEAYRAYPDNQTAYAAFVRTQDAEFVAEAIFATTEPSAHLAAYGVRSHTNLERTWQTSLLASIIEVKV